VGAETLLMEHVAPNPVQGFVGGWRLIDMLRAKAMTGLAAMPHAPYEV
jgi:hypothetical protein